MDEKRSLPEKIIRFIESLYLTAGAFVKRPFILRDWQKEIIFEVYGNNRQCKNALLTMGRKNGKTEYCGAIALAHLWLPELASENQEIICAASDREQASILFNVVKNMILFDDELPIEFNIIDSRKHLIHLPTNGKLKVVPAVEHSLHGLNPSTVFCDEAGNWPPTKGRSIYNILTSGFGAQRNPLVWSFSTQSADDTHFFSELVDYGKAVNKGEIEDKTFKAFIFEIPKEKDAFNEKNWDLANPAIDDFRSRDDMREFAKKALKLPLSEAQFRQLYCNQRVDSRSPFISRNVWDQNNREVDIEKLYGKPCFGGLDLSATTDITAFVLVFPSDDCKRFDVLSWFWKPKELIEVHQDRDRAPYTIWERDGDLLTTPGKVIGYDFVAQTIAEISQDFDIQSILFDRWKIKDLSREMDKIGLTLDMRPCGQGFKDFGPCVDVLEKMLLEKRVYTGKNPLLTWMASNAIVQLDPAGNRKIDKQKSRHRVDGIVALAMALRSWEHTQGEAFGSIYDDDSFYKSMEKIFS